MFNTIFLRAILIVTTLFMCFSSNARFIDSAKPETLGKFNVAQDLFLAHFDSKTDVDDIHSIAGVATILADQRLANVRFHAVAGAYGIQDGLYVPAAELFDLAFGVRWSDAHVNYSNALKEVSELALQTLATGGDIWIAEAGQSDFSSDLIAQVKNASSTTNTKLRIHVVQHSEWNQDMTTPEKLAYVKANSDYHKIPDGNAIGNGSPGFTADVMVNFEKCLDKKRLTKIWLMAIEIAENYNGEDGRYNNPSIAKGGVDFSDVAEAAWIFGFNRLVDVEDFFQEFGAERPMGKREI